MFTKYYGRNHFSHIEQEILLPEPKTALEMLSILSILNVEAPTYGITYYTKEPDHV